MNIECVQSLLEEARSHEESRVRAIARLERQLDEHFPSCLPSKVCLLVQVASALSLLITRTRTWAQG